MRPSPVLLRASVLVLCALALTLPLAAQTSSAGTEITLLSFNIRYDNPADGENNWQYRRERIAGMLRFHDADLVGMQEALFSQINDLERLLPGYAWCGVGRDDGKQAGEFSPIFYKKDRFTLLRQGTFWLSPQPDSIGSRGWDAALPRIVTWAELRESAGGARFFQFNTHFDHIGEVARVQSARLLREKISSIAGESHVLVTGDFNANDSTDVYRHLTESSETTSVSSPVLYDALDRSTTPHYGPVTTWNGFKEIEPGRRIDFVFVSRSVEALRHAILTDRWDGRFLSDHLPVIARVRIPGGK